MCGIFGVVSTNTLTEAQKKFLYDAFICDQVRGMHGTGMFTVNTRSANKQVTVAKAAVDALTFLNTDVSDPLDGVNGSLRTANLAIGHNRYTTSGENLDDHCHPFEYDTLVGVHNGGVGDSVLSIIDKDKTHAVDSARIYAALSKADNPVDVLKQIHSGAYALVWYDKRTNNLHMARNDTRPLAVATLSSGLFIASEMGMLTWLLGRSKGTYADFQVGWLDPYKLYTVPMDDPASVSVEDYTPEKPPVVTVGGWGSWLTQPAPEPTTHRRFWSPMSVMRDFPVLKDHCQWLTDMGYTSVARMSAYVLGECEFEDTACWFGKLTDAHGTADNPEVFFIAEQWGWNVDKLRDKLPAGPDVEDDEWMFPMVEVWPDYVLVRPTGEILVECRISQIEHDPYYYVEMDRDDYEFAAYVCDDTYLADATDDAVRTLWTALKDGTAMKQVKEANN